MNTLAYSIADEVSQLPVAGLRAALAQLSSTVRRYTPTIQLNETDHRDLALAVLEFDNGDIAGETEVAAVFRDVRAAFAA